jgi:hypothetical protein
MEAILSLIAIIISVIALICSLADTQLAIEYFFSNEYLLIKMKPDAELIPHTHSYVSNCKFCGIIDTSWYAFDKEEKDNILTLIKYNLLREGMSGTTIDSLNLQRESDIILVTRKGKKLAKKMKIFK